MFLLGVLSLLVVHCLSYNPLHDTASPEFRSLASETYRKVLPCITSAWMYHKGHPNFSFPDDAEEHFAHLKNSTAMFRLGLVHSYAGYSGPWMENIFVNSYLNVSLHTFGGLIPIFIPWVDAYLQNMHQHIQIYKDLIKLLRPNVLYVTMSQGDDGLRKVSKRLPNILVLSAGGFGHIPLPLIKGELPVLPQPVKFEQDIGFYGNAAQSTRPEMLGTIKTAAESLNMTFKLARGPNWHHDMQHTKFNLAPRGFGRNSFRFSESIQMGRIPVFLYNDIPWVPYAGTNASIETYGFLAGSTSKSNTLVKMVHQLKSLTDKEYQAKLDGLQRVRNHFTYQGLFQQFDLFLKDPFGPEGGDLRCIAVPYTELCCDE